MILIRDNHVSSFMIAQILA